MRLVFPNELYRDKAEEFIKEFYEHNSQINGTGGLDRYLRESDYYKWLKKLNRELDLANIPEGNVPAITYFYVREDDDKIVGMINLRLVLNDFLKKEGGHIGYCIRPTERGRGYGKQMLADILKVCDLLSIKDVMITCDTVNIASASVAKSNGGVLVEEFFSDNYSCMVQKYIINRN